MDPGSAWLVGLVSMLVLFFAIYWKEGKLRQALIYALLWGKLLATVFWVLGLDIPLLQIYTLQNGMLTPRLTITANITIFTSFLLTNITAVMWPQLSKEFGIKSNV